MTSSESTEVDSCGNIIASQTSENLNMYIIGINSDNSIAVVSGSPMPYGIYCGTEHYNSSILDQYTTDDKNILWNQTTFTNTGWTLHNHNDSFLCNEISDLGSYSSECNDEFNGYLFARIYTLKSDVNFTGSGTEEDPYVIK